MSDSVIQALIDAAESAAGKWLIARVLVGIGVASTTWYYGAVVWAVTIAVGIVVKYGDVIGFMLIDGWENTVEGVRLEQAADALNNLPKDASDEERQKLELEQMAAFEALQGMGTLPNP